MEVSTLLFVRREGDAKTLGAHRAHERERERRKSGEARALIDRVGAVYLRDDPIINWPVVHIRSARIARADFCGRGSLA